MSVKKPSTIDVRGMSVQDILNIPYENWNSLGEADLRALTQRLNSVANKRINRIIKSGLADFSPAVIARKGGKRHSGKLNLFSSITKEPRKATKNRKGIPSRTNQLREKFAEVRSFLTDKETATVAGAKKNRAEVLTRFPELTERQQKRVWKIWGQLRNMKGLPHLMKDYFDSERLQNILADYIKNPSKLNGNRTKNTDLLNFIDRVSEKMYANPNVNPQELVEQVKREMQQDALTESEEGEGNDDGITLQGDFLQ